MDRVFLIAGASTGIGAATARQPPRPATSSCSARAPRTSSRRWRRNSAGSPSAATSPTTPTSRRWSSAPGPNTAGSTSFRQRRRRPPARVRVRRRRGGQADGADQRLRHLRDDPRDRGRAAGDQGPPRDHEQHRRPARAERLLYSATKFAVTGMAEAARQDFNGTGVRTTLISPGMVETAGLQPRPRGDPDGRRHRPRGDVRGRPAAAHGRQRDPDPADGAGLVDESSFWSMAR